MGDHERIISTRGEKLSDEELLKYLHTSLSEEEKKTLEEQFAGSFETDAIDGLQQIKDKEQIRVHVKQLHQKLPHLLRLKKQRKEKKQVNQFEWIIIALLVLLFICVITYVVINMHK